MRWGDGFFVFALWVWIMTLVEPAQRRVGWCILIVGILLNLAQKLWQRWMLFRKVGIR